MSKTMPKSTSEEKYRWIKPILSHEITIKDMAKVCPFCERSLKYWLASFRKHGITGLENGSRRPKSHPKETPIRIKEEVIALRRKTRLCANKLSWQLRKEGVIIHPRTIGKFLKLEGLVRKYRSRKARIYPKYSFKAGELVEIDIKYVPKKLKGKQYYQFTAIDCATRWRFMRVYEEQSNLIALKFLDALISNFSRKILAIKTDNAAIFTNRYTGYLNSCDILNPRLHPFDLECKRLGIVHYLIDPGKPQQNGRVERSHRTDQEQFYEQTKFKSFEELRYKIKLWNMYYNDLEHCALNGLTPNQALREKVQNVRA
jgi:transposase-like protein